MFSCFTVYGYIYIPKHMQCMMSAFSMFEYMAGFVGKLISQDQMSLLVELHQLSALLLMWRGGGRCPLRLICITLLLAHSVIFQQQHHVCEGEGVVCFGLFWGLSICLICNFFLNFVDTYDFICASW